MTGTDRDDSGTTMIEMVVSLSIMSMVLAMFTTAILSVHRFANKTESISSAQTQVNLAFLRLDREVRYAAGLSTPGQVGADSYVEYLVVAGGIGTCTELRLHRATGQLQHRTWVHGTAPVVPTGWRQLAMGVSQAQPFTVLPPDETVRYLRLRLQLTATAGAGTSATSTQTDVTFTARNTSLTTPSASACTEGRAVP